MAGLSSPGVGSGLDINSLVSKLMSIEQKPLTNLAAKEASYQAKLTAFGTLKGALSALQTATKTLASTSTFDGMATDTSDSSVISASADTTAAAGSYDIAVSQLAKAHQVHTNVNYGSDTFDSGTLRITIGTGTPTDVVLSATSTLSDIRDAINDAAAGVTATVVNDGTADRLVLTSNSTGTDGAIAITATATNSDGTRRLDDLVGANLATDQAAQNAEFTINSLAVSRSSNTVTDVISGVTLNLKKADATTPPTSKLTVTKNTSAVESAVNAFVKAYNGAIGQVKSLTTYDATNKKASTLTGDATARSIQSQLTSAISATISGVNGGISSLSDVGIAIQKDGTLAVDSSKLTTALNASYIDIGSLFTSTENDNQGIAVRFAAILDGVVGTGGSISSRTDGIASSIRLIGKQRDALGVRLTAVEARYRAQFNAMDSLVSSMQSTQTYLTQQLAQISSMTSSSK